MHQHLKRLFGMVIIVLWTVGCAAATPGPRETVDPSGGSPSSVGVGSPRPTNIPQEGTLGGSSRKIGNWTVALFSSPNPPIRGSNILEALVTDPLGKPVTDATVSFDIDMTNMSHGKNVVTAKSSGNGRYAGTLFFMMPGPWRVIVAIASPGQPAASERFNFTVNFR